MSSGLTVTFAIAGDTLDLVRLALAMNEDKRADNASLEAMLRERSRQHGGIMFLDRHLQAPHRGEAVKNGPQGIRSGVQWRKGRLASSPYARGWRRCRGMVTVR